MLQKLINTYIVDKGFKQRKYEFQGSETWYLNEFKITRQQLEDSCCNDADGVKFIEDNFDNDVKNDSNVGDENSKNEELKLIVQIITSIIFGFILGLTHNFFS